MFCSSEMRQQAKKNVIENLLEKCRCKHAACRAGMQWLETAANCSSVFAGLLKMDTVKFRAVDSSDGKIKWLTFDPNANLTPEQQNDTALQWKTNQLVVVRRPSHQPIASIRQHMAQDRKIRRQ